MEDTLQSAAPVSADPAPDQPTPPPSEPDAPIPSRNEMMRVHEVRWEVILEKLQANWIGLRNAIGELKDETDRKKWIDLNMQMKATFADEQFNMNGVLLGLFDDVVRKKMSGITIAQELPDAPAPIIMTPGRG